MTTPQDPFSAPDPAATPPPPAPSYGAPGAYGAQPAYGAPGAYGEPASPFGHHGGPQLAQWGTRVAAALLDGLIVVAIIIASLVVGAVLSAVSDGLGALVVIVGYLGGFGFLLWQLVVQGSTGQTIGKKAMKIRLLCEQDGQVVGPGLSVGRYFVHIVDSLPCYVGYLWPLWDHKRQTFADKILKTVVVKV